ncbi:pleckstrin homology domain-containing family G member 4B [Echinops telfairi]|uniref:Pleckstrin homology domain-containing family G member 4B n=1 Tax=Echinops telfairi TaxID=9371 RepID=A0ABM0IER3_ECHTE|nr:pleckstrin homology domain-containing family G member 4B [Echinops telfairi]
MADPGSAGTKHRRPAQREERARPGWSRRSARQVETRPPNSPRWPTPASAPTGRFRAPGRARGDRGPARALDEVDLGARAPPRDKGGARVEKPGGLHLFHRATRIMNLAEQALGLGRVDQCLLVSTRPQPYCEASGGVLGMFPVTRGPTEVQMLAGVPGDVRGPLETCQHTDLERKKEWPLPLRWLGAGTVHGAHRSQVPAVSGTGAMQFGLATGLCRSGQGRAAWLRTVRQVGPGAWGRQVAASQGDLQVQHKPPGQSDGEPLDAHVQSTLAVLHLLCEATVATVLRPSILQASRPPGVREKVVVQLVAPRGVQLGPGDLHMQVVAKDLLAAKLVGAGELLEPVSAVQGSFPLQSCLLATSPSVHCAQWDRVLDPAFIPQGRPRPERPQLHSVPETPTPAMAGPRSQQGTSTLQPPSGCPGRGPPAPRESSDEGVGGPRGGPGLLDGRGSPEAFYAGGPSPGSGGRWFRKSYVEALRNPVPLGASSEESLLDEAVGEAARPLTPGTRPKVATSPVQRTPRESHLQTDRAVTASRRSRSWDKPLRSPLSNKLKTRQETSDPAGHQPEGRPGGQAAGTGTIGSCVAVGNPESPQEVEGAPLASTSSPGLVPGTCSDKLLGPKGAGTPELGAPGQAWGDISALLHVGAVMLPGTRDRCGRAVVQVCTGGPSWTGEQASRAELTRLLLYLHSVPRKEVRDLGLVVLVDTRKGPVTPALSQALLSLQNTTPPIIHSILLLVDKESVIKPDKEAALQCDVVSSLKALHKLIDSSQLTAELDGTFPYSHRDWVCFRRKLEPFMASCKQAFAFLQDALCALSTRRAPGTAQEATELIHRHRAVMQQVLEEPLLVTLRLEGGAVLARLRRDALGASEDGRDALRAATRLYDRVDEEVHRLVRASNQCLQWLEGLQGLRPSEQGPAQVPHWLEREPELTIHPKEPPTPGSQSEGHEGIPALQEAAALAAGWRPPCREDPECVGSCCLQADAAREPRPSQALWSPPPSCPEQALPELRPGCSSLLSPREASPAQEDMHWGPGVPALGDPPDSSSPSTPASSRAAGPRLRKQSLKKMMKTQSWEAVLPAGPREPRQPAHTGVHIRGLEVTGSVATETPTAPRNRSLSSPSRIPAPNGDGRPRVGSRLHHIVAEMVSTEREYVKSLGYVIDNYFPEMERTDLPQDLRGKRGTIFGNLEKLHGFHGQHFLRELERCRHCPLAVGRGFLKHEEQFGMYALYSKNKPLSDALLSSHGNAFFKAKQQALGDKMDLASYLLKPVQRMSKYALLLGDLVKEAGRSPAREQELRQLRAAESMVRFQLRHGNDLLAMDAVRGCDVNLKEQGPLRCQDEFVVCCGRRKYLRQVFLFEDLILFSKTKKADGGYDIYVYKQSFKTAEIGMTENVGDSGLRFEIWFRRRRRSQDTYILQASSAEVKAAWTGLIGRILWRQALRNRELRMQEMVSMGIGNKPFMDIQPSDAAISDRAIDYLLKRTEPRARASIAVSSFDRAAPFKRPHSTISESSTSSSSSRSSSVRGHLNLHVYPSSPGPLSPWPRDGRACIEEDELEQETGSQPSMTTESSASSQCTSGDSAGCPGSPPHPGLRQLADEDGASSPGCRTPNQGASPPLPSRSSRWLGGQLTTAVSGLAGRQGDGSHLGLEEPPHP